MGRFAPSWFFGFTMALLWVWGTAVFLSSSLLACFSPSVLSSPLCQGYVQGLLLSALSPSRSSFIILNFYGRSTLGESAELVRALCTIKEKQAYPQGDPKTE